MIEGGNHSQFGSYGLQKGDTAAKITPEQQVAETVAAVRACGFTDPALSGRQRPTGPDPME